MNQKFINLVEKTQKKAPLYDQSKAKRFARKRSQQSDRSIDSKRSRNTAIQPPIKYNQIDQGQSKNAKIHINTGDFFQQLANSVMLSKQLLPNKQRYSRGRTDRFAQQHRRQSRESRIPNYQVQNQALSAELQVRTKQLQVMVSECQMIKQSLKNQQQRRRQLQQQKKQLTTQLSQKSKQLQTIQLQSKKLTKEKQYLTKQIQFLERINYDDKTRNAQSYREKYLAKELEELRKQLTLNKSQIEKHLEQQIKRLSDEKYSVQKLYQALKVEKQTLIKQFQKYKHQERNHVLHSEEYCQLRDKYKACLDNYKNLKIQYLELQKELNKSLKNIPQHLLNSNQSLSIVLSSSSSEKSCSSLDKENKHVLKVNRNDIYTQPVTQRTPVKKSLSPRNREQKIQADFKKPISPVSNKKSFETSNTTPQPKTLVKQPQKKTEKKTTYFNEAYRLKIGLGKSSTQK